MKILIVTCYEPIVESDVLTTELKHAIQTIPELNERIAKEKTGKKILHIKYPQSLNGLILATELENSGIDFELVNGQSFEDFMNSSYEDSYTHILVSTTYIHSIEYLKKVLTHIRKHFSSKIIVGGPFIFNNKEVISLDDADVLIFGDGEEAVVSAIKGEEHIGVLYKKKNKFESDFTPNVVDINNSQFINWNNFFRNIPDELVTNYKEEYAFPIETMRGCPFKCAFCNYGSFHDSVRFKSAERIVAEIERLAELGVKNIGIWDSNFTFPKSRLLDVCRLIIEKGLDYMNFSSYARLTDLDEEVLESLEKAGFSMLYLGVESANNEILKKMNKGTSKELIYDKMTLLKKYNFVTWCSFIVGFPGETKETIKETFNLIKELKIDYLNLQVLQVRYGSKLHIEPERYGLTYTMENRQAYSWKHNTMNSEEAVEYALDFFCKIAEETDSLCLENIMNVSNIPREFPPYHSKKNKELLLFIQKKMSEIIRNKNKIKNDKSVQDKKYVMER